MQICIISSVRQWKYVYYICICSAGSQLSFLALIYLSQKYKLTC